MKRYHFFFNTFKTSATLILIKYQMGFPGSLNIAFCNSSTVFHVYLTFNKVVWVSESVLCQSRNLARRITQTHDKSHQYQLPKIIPNEIEKHVETKNEVRKDLMKTKH